ncbi:hypothetical protein Xen7305DRAFT_00038260 [Xenococcus sp. PCC 7305]|uniref:hypothetical protein n=1 Tax=Xenococcus sp. PCC 7305 TaxID=102125 RepID=UPI0002ABC90E|nr:hypothetical protein [Xenococcus sp. PCC 7305]ELS04098.1 hypothetical protein Xen7305DRAFT_00038260 [Xenococcus sp. PCC 7305]
MSKIKTLLLGTVILSAFFAISPQAVYSQRRQCDPSKEECSGRQMRQETKLPTDNMLNMDSSQK